MKRLLTHIRIIGLMLVVYSLTYLLPILTSLIYEDGTLEIFLFDMVMTLGSGLFLWALTRQFQVELKARDG